MGVVQWFLNGVNKIKIIFEEAIIGVVFPVSPVALVLTAGLQPAVFRTVEFPVPVGCEFEATPPALPLLLQADQTSHIQGPTST